MSAPAEWAPNVAHSTSVVPEPANGSSTLVPGARCRRRHTSTSCGTNLPRYGWSRWTCFVRSRSFSSCSAQESSRSRPGAPRPAYTSYSVATRGRLRGLPDARWEIVRWGALRMVEPDLEVRLVAEGLAAGLTAAAEPDGRALLDLPDRALRIDDVDRAGDDQRPGRLDRDGVDVGHGWILPGGCSCPRVGGLERLAQVMAGDVGVDLGRGAPQLAEQLLHRAQVAAA